MNHAPNFNLVNFNVKLLFSSLTMVASSFILWEQSHNLVLSQSADLRFNIGHISNVA